MNDRAFRFDLFIAVCALLISAIAAFASLMQTRALQDQYAAAIWPYLSVDSTESSHGVTVDLTNDGLGPALVRSAQLHFDGRLVSGWGDAVGMLTRDPAFHGAKRGVVSSQMSSLDASTTIRPGEALRLVSVTLSKNTPIKTLLRHEIALDVCYCSLNDRCWTLHSTPSRANPTFPQLTSHCAVGASIGASTVQ